MSDATIKEFLVGLGFKLDEAGWSRFQSTVETAALKAKILGDVIESVAKSIAGSVARIAGDFEDLFYASGRLGASVESIRAFGYAVSQMGGTVAGAQGSLKSFGDWMRQTPGAEKFLQSFGVATRDAQGHAIDRGQMLLSIGEKLAAMSKQGPAGAALASQYAGIFGIDQETLLAIERQGTRGRYNEAVSGAKSAGIGGPMAEAAKRFEQALRDTFQRIGDFASGAEGKLLAYLSGPLEKFNTWLDAHKDQINDALGKMAETAGKFGEKILASFEGVDWGKFPDKIDHFVTSLGNLTEQFGHLFDNLEKTRHTVEAIIGALIGAKLGGMFGPIGAVVGGAAGALAPGMIGAEMDPNAPHSADVPGAVGGWWKRNMPGWLGGGGGKAGAGAGTEVAPPGPPGTYRPQYNVTDKDVSDAVVNTIAGEASTSNPAALDAVINNMFNRLGTHTYGPSGNLEEVARAPGQYTGYRAANAKEAELIRSRIRAIASGGMPDTTKGSNEYRADWYHGPWGWNHPDGINIGGNVFANNPKGGIGPYGAYPEPKKQDVASGGGSIIGGAKAAELPASSEYGAYGSPDTVRANLAKGLVWDPYARRWETAAKPSGGIIGSANAAERSPWAVTKGQQPWEMPDRNWDHLNNALPIGGGGTVNNNAGDKHVSSNISNTITVTAPDPHSAAAAVGLHLDRTSADVARNLQGAIA